MGILDSIESMAGQASGANSQNAQVAGGLMQELQQHPQGAGGLFSALQSNGMGGMVQQWAGGQTGGATPQQMQQGLGGTGIIERISQRTGLPETAVQMGLAAAVPLVINHLVSNGHMTSDGQSTGAPPPDQGGMLQSVLGRLI